MIASLYQSVILGRGRVCLSGHRSVRINCWAGPQIGRQAGQAAGLRAPYGIRLLGRQPDPVIFAAPYGLTCASHQVVHRPTRRIVR